MNKLLESHNMTRSQFRAAVQKRVNASDKKDRAELGLPKALYQFAVRHGANALDIKNQRLKYPH